MRNRAFRLAAFLAAAAAAVVSADIAPDAAEMLLTMGGGEKEVRIENLFYACVNGTAFAVVRNGKPENAEDYDVVEAGGLTVYVPKFMSFEGGVPKIVTFPRKTGYRDVGAANVTS